MTKPDRLEYFKKYGELHREEKNARSRQNYLDNKEKVLERTHKYYKKHKKQHSEWNKQHYQKNRIKIVSQQKERRHNNAYLRVVRNLRVRLYQVLRGNPRTTSMLELLGCSAEFLRKHLQSKFKKGMTWGNYGKWHVDHKIPCDFFDLTDIEQQHRCFHHSNLQPLWAKENISKSNKLEEVLI